MAVKGKKTPIKKRKRGNPNWKKGVTTNPSGLSRSGKPPPGKPKGALTITKQLRALFKKPAKLVDPVKEYCVSQDWEPKNLTVGEVFATMMVMRAMQGNATIAHEIFNRIDGKIPDVVRNEIDGDARVSLDNVSDNTLRKIVKGKVKNGNKSK